MVYKEVTSHNNVPCKKWSQPPTPLPQSPGLDGLPTHMDHWTPLTISYNFTSVLSVIHGQTWTDVMKKEKSLTKAQIYTKRKKTKNKHKPRKQKCCAFFAIFVHNPSEKRLDIPLTTSDTNALISPPLSCRLRYNPPLSRATSLLSLSISSSLSPPPQTCL